MKAMRIHTLGAPMVLEEVADPTPGKGEALLRVSACGVNFADTLMVQGKYQEKPALPFSPGMELCGEVIDGNGTHLKPGMRVATMAGHGGFAEKVAVPAMACVPLP
ncbi:MAG: alcohol dehydrogenase catalytic domain-containing protein, partial [Pseudomonadota bacterium]